MNAISQIDQHFIEQHTDFLELISLLKGGFSSKDIVVPLRHHHDFSNPQVNADSTLLLMPAWNPSKSAGVKIVTVSPENSQFNLPSINGVYIYLDAVTGELKALLEAKSLTVKRTAAASALASSFLSKKEASSLLMIGTGALSTNLIRAHANIRPIKQVYVWGRHFEKAKLICEQLANQPYTLTPITSIASQISNVDIISCATLSKTPLVLGKYIKAGQHIDLVGAYKKDMREADNDLIAKASVFVDSYEGGLKESGDIVIPIQQGVLKASDVKADLFELSSKTKTGRASEDEITVFKSVGHALEDLIAADYYYKQFTNA